MRLWIISLLLATLAPCLRAQSKQEEVYRIEIGKDFNGYSNSDLKRRVWELERAVEQLQRRVFMLEAQPVVQKPVQPDSWLCEVKAFGKSFSAAGATKAVATLNAVNNCKKELSDDGFHCKAEKVSCSQ